MKTKPSKKPSPLALAAKKAKARQAANGTKPAAKSKSKPAAATPKKARRLEEIAASKKGLFAIDPTLLSVEPGFNKRENFGDMNQLADDIAANGLDQPLKIRKVKDTEIIYIVAGHRRHKAITEILIPQGRWHHEDGSIKTVDCYSESQGTSKIDRLFSQISGNGGLSYTLLEKAAVYQDILREDPTIKPADISRRYGETKQAVSDALRLVNHGCHLLIENVRHGTVAASTAVTIIKQVGNETDAQEQCFQAALATAHAAGRSHVMPKDLPASTTEPTPGREPSDYWTYGDPPSDYGWNPSKVATTPDTLTAAPHALLPELLIHAAHRNGKWFSALNFRSTGGSVAGGGGLPSYKDTPFPTLEDAIRHAWDGFCEHDLPQIIHRHPKAETLLRHCIKLGHDLSARFPTGTPWDESTLTKLIPAPGGTQDTSIIVDTEDDDDDEPPAHEPSTDAPTEGMRFDLYVVDGVPETPVEEDSPFYHETDRFVLIHPELLPEGLGLIHLLFANTPFGGAYGFRSGSHERLPDTSHIETLDTEPAEGFKAMLEAAIQHAEATDRPQIGTVRDELHALLEDALRRYFFPASGEPEEPGHLTFVPETKDQSGSNNPGFQQTLNSPGGGSGGGNGGGTGYAPPDKQMEKIDKLLEDLAETDGKPAKGDPSRKLTTEIVLAVLRNEQSITNLRNHLMGK